jgi:hypothetical protein
LNAESGWSDVWSFDGKGNLCFGGNIIMTKPDMRTAKELSEVYYQKGATEGLTVDLDAGEVAESITVSGNDVTAVIDTSVAGKVTIPAAAIETLATGEYAVVISTANYKYETTFVYADVVISTPAEWCNFLTQNLSSSYYNKFTGQYIVLKNDIDFTTYDYGSASAWISGAKVKALNVTGNGRGKASFCGTLDGRGHSVINFGVVIGVFDYIEGATIKNIGFIGLNNLGGTAWGLAYIARNSACTIDNVFVSVSQNGSSYQTGILRESWSTCNVNNVIVVKIAATGAATNYGIAAKGPILSNCYAINATYMSGTKTDGITTAATLLGDTAWLKAENGWNTDVWTINTDGNLCFGENTVVEK